MDIIRRDLKDLDTNWHKVEELATDRAEWRQRVAQCIHQVRTRAELRAKVRIALHWNPSQSYGTSPAT